VTTLTDMKAVWQGRMAAINTKAAELYPMAPACCNVCRTCTTTNIVSLSIAGAVGLGALIVRFAKRFAQPS
jgi:hypothetical protein